MTWDKVASVCVRVSVTLLVRIDARTRFDFDGYT